MRAAAALLLLALALRIGAVALLDFTPVNDPADYVRHGLSIAAGDGYPPSGVSAGAETAIRPPVFPLLVAGAFAASGDSLTAARLLNALLGTAVVALTGLLAARLWGRRTGLVALAIGAVCPPQVVVGATLVTETTFTALALGAVAVLLGRRGPPSLRAAALAGALCGLAVLTRPNGVVLALPLLLAIGRRPRQAVALVLAAALVVAPWTVRNALVLDAFVPVSTSADYTLPGTYNASARDDERWPWAWREASLDPAVADLLQRHPGDDELARGERLRDTATDFLADEPLAPLAATAHNLARWTHLAGGLEFSRASAAAEGLPRGAGVAVVAGTAALLLLGLAGVARGALRGTPRWLWLAPVLLLLSVAVTVSAVRYRAPAEPFAVLLAAFALTGRRRSDRVHRVSLERPVA